MLLKDDYDTKVITSSLFNVFWVQTNSEVCQKFDIIHRGNSEVCLAKRVNNDDVAFSTQTQKQASTKYTLTHPSS